MSDYSVYVHIFPNSKLYIGITKAKPLRRWKNGKGYVNSPFVYNAINKYGWNNIKHIILMDNLTKDMACLIEQALIEKYHSNKREYGYNVCLGGEGTNGYHHTESYKQMLRQRPLSKQQKENISNTLKIRWSEGMFVNAKTFKKGQSPWNKGLTKADPRVAKHVRKKGDFHHSDISKKKMSDSKKGKPAHNRKRVLCVETGQIFDSVCQAQQITHITNISKVARDITRTAGNYHWRYI